MNNGQFLELLNSIDERLIKDGHRKIRFAVVVWNTDEPQPSFSGSNDSDMSRTAHMMVQARDFILAVETMHGAPLN